MEEPSICEVLKEVEVESEPNSDFFSSLDLFGDQQDGHLSIKQKVTNHDDDEKEEDDENEKGKWVTENKICLICGQDVVMYDADGKLINNERYFVYGQERTWSRAELFSSLCRALRLLKSYGKLKEDWHFEGNGDESPFPFCGRCEQLMSALAKVYNEIKVLKKKLKEKMLDAEEEMYVKNQLYSRNDQRYFTFRQLVLLDKFRGKIGELEPMVKDLPDKMKGKVITPNTATKTIEVSQSENQKRKSLLLVTHEANPSDSLDKPPNTKNGKLEVEPNRSSASTPTPTLNENSFKIASRPVKFLKRKQRSKSGKINLPLYIPSQTLHQKICGQESTHY